MNLRQFFQFIQGIRHLYDVPLYPILQEFIHIKMIHKLDTSNLELYILLTNQFFIKFFQDFMAHLLLNLTTFVKLVLILIYIYIFNFDLFTQTYYDLLKHPQDLTSKIFAYYGSIDFQNFMIFSFPYLFCIFKPYFNYHFY